MMQFQMQFDAKNWYQPRLNLLTGTLLPFSWLFGLVTAVRRTCYRRKLLSSSSFTVPVVVVGNISVGGTGKTPCVIALAKYLSSIGYHPGIVARGVGGIQMRAPQIVTATTD